MFTEKQLHVMKSALGLMLDDDDNRAALTPDQITEANQALANVTAMIDGEMIATYWCTDDVRQQMSEFEENGEVGDAAELSDEQAREVLRRIDSNFDASMGISWDDIATELRAVLGIG